MPGPPRVPTHLKLLRRNPGHQRLNRNEPVPAQPPAVPEPPAFLTGYAADEWYRVSAELHHLKLLTILDVMPLATYCTAYQRWRTAEEVLGKMAEKDPATSALLVRGPDGAPRQNPMVKIAANAAADMITYAGHFGMTALARARISAGAGFEPPPGGGKFDGLIA
jgi:P27 family predicted phage terminase small subunit